MKISWLILTYNRADIVYKSLRHNFDNAGRGWDELIWVDNGSLNPEVPDCEPTISVGFDKNRGVARGYNAAMALATGDLLLITGCDRLMPDNWLAKMVEPFERNYPVAATCIWERPAARHPERILQRQTERYGYQSVLPLGARLFTRDLVRRAGFLREDFGLYGWEDVEWAHRAARTAAEFGLHCFLIPETAEHLGSEGAYAYDGKDDADYHAFKKREAEDPKKRELFEKCKREGFPYYNPFI